MTIYINHVSVTGANVAIDPGTEDEDKVLWHRENGDTGDTGYWKLETRGSGPGWIQVGFGPAEIEDDDVVVVGIVWRMNWVG